VSDRNTGRTVPLVTITGTTITGTTSREGGAGKEEQGMGEGGDESEAETGWAVCDAA
jgi:hypothetical protein